jgi:outer membrane immunogenic protein
MVRALVAGLLTLATVGQASAGDLGAPVPPQPPTSYVPRVAPVTNWGGLYIGANGGYGFGNSNWSDGNNAVLTTGNFNTSGALVGGTFGANFQADALVLGIEADLDWSGIKGGLTTSPPNGFCNLPVNVSLTASGSTCETKSDWLGTVRARVGYAADRFLVFATGGAAFGSVQTGLTGAGAGAGSFQSATNYGWTVGAGVEVALFSNWTAKVEYLYVDLGSATCNALASCGVDAINFTTGIIPANDTVRFTTNLVRFGVNYKFGSW